MRLIQHAPKREEKLLRTLVPIAESIVPLDICGRRMWDKLSCRQLVECAKWHLRVDKVSTRKELEKADRGLYQALTMRRLLDETGLPNANISHRNWTGMERDVLVVYAKRTIAENGIKGRSELDEQLYCILRRRELLDVVGLPNLRGEMCDWAGMGRDELVAQAKLIIGGGAIAGRAELSKAYPKLYQALMRRKLLDDVGLPNSREHMRDWTKYNDDELVALAKRYIAEMGITGRKGLEDADSGRYQLLRRRKLLDDVFSDAESSKHKEAVVGVLEALGSFGDEK